MQKHIIHRQKVLLEIPGEKEAFNYQNTVSRLFNNGLQTAAEDVLNTMCIGDEIVRIDRLQLDLGIIDAKLFEKEFKDRFIEVLKQQVSLSKSKAPGKEKEIIKPAASQQQALCYFLLHGTLPWYSEVENIQAWERNLLAKMGAAEWHAFIKWLQPQTGKGNEVLQRLVLQFSDAFLAKVAQQLYESTQPAEHIDADTCLQWHKDILQIIDSLFPKSKIQGPDVWLDIFLLLSLDSTPGIDAFIEKIIGQILPRSNAEVTSNYKNALLQNIQPGAVKDVCIKISNLLEKGLSLQLIMEYTSRGRLDDLYIQDKLDNNNIEPIASPETNVKHFHRKKNKPGTAGNEINISDREEVLYAGNCGVVLLHPFLAPYFTGLGLMDNKRFVNEEAQQRAVLLLFYLATGETEAAEFNLILQKILCGYGVEETLPANVVLSQLEIDESDNLLRSVIDYWPPLKSTSVAGFRDAFINREGRLSMTNNGWLLKVEQKTVDILLGKLPWGFSTIRLPWMQQMINVEWA